MLAVFASQGEGASKQEIVDALRREETNRGLAFEYCLLTLGSSHNRAVSPQRWQKGEVLSIDSGGNYHGYIGDLCRMARARRARRRTRGHSCRDRDGAAGGVCQGQPGHDGRRHDLRTPRPR